MESNRRQAYRRSEDLRLQKHEHQFEAAQRLCQSFFNQYHLDDLIARVLHVALDATGGDSGSILLADSDTQRLVFRHVVGNRAAILQGTSFPWDQGIAGAVYRSGRPEVVPDAKKDPRHFAEVDRLAHYETRDMITVPLKKWDGDPIGVLNVLNKQDGPLNADDLGLLTIIAAFAALAIQQAQTFEQAKKAEVVDLLGNIGHDLKNMMQPLVSATDLLDGEIGEVFGRLTRKDLEASQQSRRLCDEMLTMVRHTSRRIQDRVKQIADCVKGLSSPPQFKPVNIAGVVDSVLKTLLLLAQEKTISLQTHGLADLPTVLADEHRLFNAFYNLVNNAIPEVPKGGSIFVRGRHEPADRSVLIDVADTGCGMPPEIRDVLFTGRVVTTKKGGTGLGTKIVKDVVDAHKGKIWVESTVGAGSTFHIQLPLDPR
jgi:signal transduction histidine kinase